MILAILLINCKISIGQIPVITTPQPATMNINGFQPNNGVQYVNPMQYQQNEQLRIQQQNEQIIREVEQNERLRQQQNQIINDAYNDFNSTNNGSFSFPSFAGSQGTNAYNQAFNELEQMLNGSKPKSITRAVFIPENAYYENSLPYENYRKIIDNIVYVCNLQMKKDRSPNTNLAKNMSIFKFMSDTINLKLPNKEQNFTHLPMKYDFRDCWGDTIWENMFVTKLLMTQSGQCHSMPLLYLTLAEQMKAKAYLSFCPNHSYVKIPIGNNKYQNLELTSGLLTTDAFVMQSGYVKSGAIENHIYMDTVGTQGVIATCLVDLANGYAHKYGYDEFYIKCVETALKYHSANISGLISKSNYYNKLVYYIGINNPNISKANIKDFPQAYETMQKADSSYYFLQEIGYERIPREIYEKWRQSANVQESKQSYMEIRQSLKSIK